MSKQPCDLEGCDEIYVIDTGEHVFCTIEHMNEFIALEAIALVEAQEA